jgi:Zn-dependent protease
MLGHSGYTSYDLTFSLAGIPVRVHPLFWIVGALFGQYSLRLGLDFLLAWMIVFFISILVHELGHALAAMYFGYRPSIYLYGMGGLAQYTPIGRYNRGQSLAITFAGPAAGFALAGLAMYLSSALQPALMQLPPRPGQLLFHMLSNFFLVNMFWSVLNLFPVLPMDGGKICLDILTYVDRARGQTWTHWIGVLCGGAIGLFFLNFGAFWGAFVFLMMAYQNFQALQYSRWR